MFAISIAWRFLTEGRLQTLLILIGISVGVGVQVFLSALIGGLQKDLINKTVGTSPHITVRSPARTLQGFLPDSSFAITAVAGGAGLEKPLRTWQPLVRQLDATGYFTTVSPYIDGAGFAFRSERSEPVVLRGLDVEKADRIYRIRARMKQGGIQLTANGVLIGTELASKLRLSQGSTIRITSSQGNGDVFTVRGIFDLESRIVNASWVILTLERMQALSGYEGGIGGLELQVPKVFDAERIANGLASSYPELEWTSWQKENASLLTALRSQSGSSNLIQVLVLLAITLGISSVLAVSSIQKSRQIGILKAMGATRGTIRNVFLIMGGILGFTGSVIGCFAGYWLVTAFLSATAKANNGTPLFPLSVEFSLFLVSSLVATAAGTLSASFPARRSAKLDPAVAIRNG